MWQGMVERGYVWEKEQRLAVHYTEYTGLLIHTNHTGKSTWTERYYSFLHAEQAYLDTATVMDATGDGLDDIVLLDGYIYPEIGCDCPDACVLTFVGDSMKEVFRANLAEKISPMNYSPSQTKFAFVTNREIKLE